MKEGAAQVESEVQREEGARNSSQNFTLQWLKNLQKWN